MGWKISITNVRDHLVYVPKDSTSKTWKIEASISIFSTFGKPVYTYISNHPYIFSDTKYKKLSTISPE